MIQPPVWLSTPKRATNYFYSPVDVIYYTTTGKTHWTIFFFCLTLLRGHDQQHTGEGLHVVAHRRYVKTFVSDTAANYHQRMKIHVLTNTTNTDNTKNDNDELGNDQT